MTVNGSSIAGRRVLIVEDNFHIAGAIARVLKAQGAEIVGLVRNREVCPRPHVTTPSASTVRCWIPTLDIYRGKPLWHLFPDNGTLHRK